MNRRDLRRVLDERRRALQRATIEERERVRELLEVSPLVQRERRRRLRRRILLLLLVLLLGLVRCECAEESISTALPFSPRQMSKEPPTAQVVPLVPLKAPQRAFSGRVTPKPRGQYDIEMEDPPRWLQDFRRQVAARSPRLARCFNGANHPGAWRWSVAVNARSGAVSDQVLTAVGRETSLGESQRSCLVEVLSTPTYQLPQQSDDLGGALLRRVSILIEF